MWWHLEVSHNVTLDVALPREDVVAPGGVPRASTRCGTAGERTWWHLEVTKDMTLDVALLEKGRDGTWRCAKSQHWMWHCPGRTWWHLEVSKDVAALGKDVVAPGGIQGCDPGCGTAQGGHGGTWRCPRMWQHLERTSWHLEVSRDVTLDVALLEKGRGGTWRCPRMEGQADGDGQRWAGGGTTREDIVTCASCEDIVTCASCWRGGVVLPAWNSQRSQHEKDPSRGCPTSEGAPGPGRGFLDQSLEMEIVVGRRIPNPKCQIGVFPPARNHSHRIPSSGGAGRSHLQGMGQRAPS
nr:uncharacterized protein LOC121471185 [Taeniopygia guttata]